MKAFPSRSSRRASPPERLCKLLRPAFWAWLLLFFPEGEASAATIRVRGEASLESRVRVFENHVELRSRLTDDTNRPIGKRRVQIFMAPAQPLKDQVLPCPGSATQVFLRDNKYSFETTPDGSSCLRLSGLAPETILTLNYEGDEYFPGAHETVRLQHNKSPVSLQFEPVPSVFSLKETQHNIGLTTRVDTQFFDPQEVSLQLVLQELSGEEFPLETARVILGQSIQLTLSSSTLRRPGSAHLIARFAGSESLSSARTTAPIIRTSEVELTLHGEPKANSDGAHFEILAAPHGDISPGGSIELSSSGVPIATVPLQQGRAPVQLFLDPSSERAQLLRARFIPSSPEWLPGAPLDFAVPLPKPSPWARLLFVGAALLLAGWLIRAWLRPGRTEPQASSPQRPFLPGKKTVDILDQPPAGVGWSGAVLDAHDGAPIASATVSVLMPSFTENPVNLTATTDELGSFHITPDAATQDMISHMEGLRLRVESPWHSRLEQSIPKAATLRIAMVSRRRWLLDQLVQWSERRGKPWASPGGATPAHIAQVAAEQQQREAEIWARRTEQAAYSAEQPDAYVEQQLESLQPNAEGPPRR